MSLSIPNGGDVERAQNQFVNEGVATIDLCAPEVAAAVVGEGLFNFFGKSQEILGAAGRVARHSPRSLGDDVLSMVLRRVEYMGSMLGIETPVDPRLPEDLLLFELRENRRVKPHYLHGPVAVLSLQGELDVRNTDQSKKHNLRPGTVALIRHAGSLSLSTPLETTATGIVVVGKSKR